MHAFSLLFDGVKGYFARDFLFFRRRRRIRARATAEYKTRRDGAGRREITYF